MKIIDKIKSAFGLKTKGVTSEYFYNGFNFVPYDNLGNYLTLTEKGNAYEKMAIVYKIVNDISNRASEAVFEQYVKKSDDEIEESELLDKLEMPNPYQTLQEFLFEVSMYDHLRGEFYIWVEGATIGKGILNLWCLPPELVTISTNGYTFRNVLIPKEQVFHSKRPHPGVFVADTNGRALSPLQVAYPQLSTIDYGNATSRKNLSNGAVPGVGWVKQQPGELPVGAEDLKAVKDHLVERYSNPQTYGEVTLVPHEIGYTKFGLSPDEAKILEFIEASEVGIANAFNYPLALLRNKTGGLNSSERRDAQKELLTVAVFPLLRRICGVFTKILNDRTQYITFDKYAYPEMETDWESMARSLSMAWWLTGNEKREVMRFDQLKDPNMDTVLVPSGFVTLDDAVMGGSSTEDQLPITDDYDNNG